MDQLLLSQAGAAVRSAGLGWILEAAAPATEGAISLCEARIGVTLPASYRGFLRQHDGLTLGIDRSENVRYQIALLGTGEIADRTTEEAERAKAQFPAESFGGLVIFCDTMDGDVCLFDRTQARDEGVPVLDGDHENDPDGWRHAVIALDFESWFRNVLGFVAASARHNDFRYWWSPGWSLSSDRP